MARGFKGERRFCWRDRWGPAKPPLPKGYAADLDSPETTPVRSPSFALVNEYKGGRTPIRHADLYRLNDPAEIEELGLFDETEEAVVIIEWADRLEAPPAGVRIAITLDLGPGDERHLTMEEP